MSRLPLNAEEAALVASIKGRTKNRREIDLALARFRAAKVAAPREQQTLLTKVADAVVGKPIPPTGRALEMWRALHG